MKDFLFTHSMLTVMVMAMVMNLQSMLPVNPMFLAYISQGGDCNDSEPLAWTGAQEVCDGVDNNW